MEPTLRLLLLHTLCGQPGRLIGKNVDKWGEGKTARVEGVWGGGGGQSLFPGQVQVTHNWKFAPGTTPDERVTVFPRFKETNVHSPTWRRRHLITDKK